jgi:protein-disulfide isomerase
LLYLHDMENNTQPHETPTPMTLPRERESLAVPIAIVIAAGLIAGAIYMNGGAVTAPKQNPGAPVEQEVTFRPVDDTDHIKGNPNAAILLVEYSDYDCPFCKQFHDTMNQIMREYGETGKVAWVYRHLPLTQLHPNAGKIAMAAECVAENAGNVAFWKFTDRVFAEKTVQDPTNMSRIAEYAVDAGADRSSFELCYSSDKMKEKIDASVAEAAAAGARGTPHTFIIVGDQKTVINGAQPYAVVKETIDGILKQIEGGA